MKVKNITKSVLTLILGLYIVALSNIGCTNKNDNNIKIGAILPLTGEGSEWGITSKNSIILAQEEYNLNNPEKQVEVIFEDSKTSSKDALNALNKLSSMNVKFIIGDIISSNVLSMAPVVERNKILLVSPGASNPDISNAGDFVFRTWQSDALEAEVGAGFVLDSLKWNRVAVLYLENGYGTGLAEGFKKNLKNKGRDIVLEESFKVGQTNFRDILTKVKKSNPDGIYLASYPEENFIILKQLKEQKLNLKVLGTQGFVSPKIEELIPTLNYPVCYSIPQPPDSTSKEVKEYLNNYKLKYGVLPGITGDAAFDAFNLLMKGIDDNGYDSEKVKAFLYSIKGYEGASGILTFNKYGDVEKPFIFNKNSYWKESK